MSQYDFDRIIDRRALNSYKWTTFDEDVLPLWVADMDFAAPPPVLEAMRQRIDEGTFGYVFDMPAFREVFVERMQRLYNWTIQPQHLLFVPGLVWGLNIVSSVMGVPGDGIIMQTPVYGPFLMVPPRVGRFVNAVDLILIQDDEHTFHYEIDFEAFEASITPQTRLFYLCNPHNPAGSVFRRDELARLAEICLRHNVTICSDEIHCDLLMDDVQHIPIASLSPEVEQNTITMMAPSKTYNLAGLGCSVMIVPNDELRTQIETWLFASGVHVNTMGFVAGMAAYRDGDDWLQAALGYMRANRDFVVDAVRTRLPGIRVTVPEATHLCWLDCRDLPVAGDPQQFFLEEARVAFNPGTFFGSAGKNFVRLNFACPRSVLAEAIDRMEHALKKLNH